MRERKSGSSGLVPSLMVAAAVLILALLFGMQSGSVHIIQAATSLFQTGDTIEVHTPYYYRTIQADYDSVTALCVYGEMFVVSGQDSSAIDFDALSLFEEHENILDSVNTRCRTLPVLLSDGDDISLYRALGYRHVNDQQQDLGLSLIHI